MRISLKLDPELAREVKRAQSVTGEKKSAVLRVAIRAGLPAVLNRLGPSRPASYFASDYPLPKDRLELESAMAKVKQRLDR